jgi:UDP-N-acetyl-D-galactosamine dehydrogenase
VDEFTDYGIKPLVYDPMVNKQEAMKEYGIELCERDELRNLDALVLAVPHSSIMAYGGDKLFEKIKDGGILADVKAVFHNVTMPRNIKYWAL